MDILSVAAIGLTGAFLSVSLKKEAPVFAACISLVTGIIIFFYVAEGLEEIIGTIGQMTKESGISPTYSAMVLKIAAVAYICRFAGDVCADAGEKAASDKIEMAGRVIIAVISAPVILTLMEAVIKYI